MIDRLAELPKRVSRSPYIRAAIFSGTLLLEAACATPPVRAQGPIEVNPPISLRVDDWQKGASRWGLSALLTGAFLLRVGSTLRQNEGSSKRQKTWNNAGLIAQGVGTVLIDSVILTLIGY